MGLRMTKPWVELTQQTIDALPAQLGVYEIANAVGEVQKIGYAGGREPFGMRSALADELVSSGLVGSELTFRHEFTHGYLTRWQELLMVYEADHARLPSGNADRTRHLGRLTPGST